MEFKLAVKDVATSRIGKGDGGAPKLSFFNAPGFGEKISSLRDETLNAFCAEFVDELLKDTELVTSVKSGSSWSESA